MPVAIGQAAHNEEHNAPVLAPITNSVSAWGAIVAFLEAMTDWHLWASLGWVVLGVGMIITGAVLWLKKAGYLPSAVPVP